MWKEVYATDQFPLPRRRTSLIAYKDYLYLYGGFYNILTPFLQDFYKYHPITQKWNLISNENPPKGRSSHSTHIYKDQLILFGGSTSFITDKNDVWFYNFDKKEWKQLFTKGEPPKPRQFQGSCLLDNNLIIFGGFCSRVAVNDLHVLSLEKNEWKEIPKQEQKGKIPDVITDHLCFAKFHFLYVFGGNVGEQGIQNSSSNIHQFNFLTNTWKIIKTKTPHPEKLSCFDGQLIDNKTFIFGGFYLNSLVDMKLTNRTYYYDLIKDDWQEIITENHPPNRYKHSVTVNSDEIFVFGGLTTLEDDEANTNTLFTLKRYGYKDILLKNLQSREFCDVNFNLLK